MSISGKSNFMSSLQGCPSLNPLRLRSTPKDEAQSSRSLSRASDTSTIREFHRSPMRCTKVKSIHVGVSAVHGIISVLCKAIAPGRASDGRLLFHSYSYNDTYALQLHPSQKHFSASPNMTYSSCLFRVLLLQSKRSLSRKKKGRAI